VTQKVAYLFGATGGLGQSLHKKLVEAGMQVILHDRIKDGDLCLDAPKICERLIVLNPDIVIFSAGINQFDWTENQNSVKILDVNLKSPIQITQALLPFFKGKNKGHFVYVTSMIGFIPMPFNSVYAASKSGLIAFSESLRRELYGTNIRVSMVAPRAIKTSMNTGIQGLFNQKTAVTMDDPNWVAEKIVAMIVSEQARLKLGWPERFFSFLQAMLPQLIDRALAAQVKIGNF
jgi:short-subunit dehydrogenase